MEAHPEYYERMVAAYVIGYSITSDFLKEQPYLKFVEGADDTGYRFMEQSLILSAVWSSVQRINQNMLLQQSFSDQGACMAKTMHSIMKI